MYLLPSLVPVAESLCQPAPSCIGWAALGAGCALPLTGLRNMYSTMRTYVHACILHVGSTGLHTYAWLVGCTQEEDEEVSPTPSPRHKKQRVNQSASRKVQPTRSPAAASKPSPAAPAKRGRPKRTPAGTCVLLTNPTPVTHHYCIRYSMCCMKGLLVVSRSVANTCERTLQYIHSSNHSL